MRVKIPEFGERKDLFAYLRKNADKIIGQKKSMSIKSDDLEFGYSVISAKKRFGAKANVPKDPVAEEFDGELPVEVIANMAGWCDSYMDVMIKDNWNKSISDLGASGQKLVYHLKDHGTNYQYTTDSIVGKQVELFTQMVDLSIFNFKSDIKKAQALMMRSLVCEDYDEKVYNLYEDGEVKQHSIGLKYIKLYLCIDSVEPEDTMYKENWDKYYSSVINKDLVDSKGYFWAVVEAAILEVSVVLFGANILTPVTSTGLPEADTENEPPKSTQSQPLETLNGNGFETKSVDYNKLATRFLSL